MIRLPAEWEPQSALLIAWPHATTDWRDVLADIEPVYVEFARAVAAVQPLWILCQDAAHLLHVSDRLQQAGVNQNHVKPILCAYNDTWIRDYGPITVASDDGARVLDFRFNGWGGKFAAGLDDAVNARLAGGGWFGSTVPVAMAQVLEGGSLETDGAGTLLTTSRCLLGASRNPGMTRTDWARLFAEQFGCVRTLWLEHGYLAGDDTDGHIDTLARFADTGTIVHASCDDVDHPNHAELRAMANELATLTRADGQPYRLIALPSPPPMYASAKLLPASYANFVIINERVLVPIYNDPADAQALDTLRMAFPDREIVGIDARAMVRQGGVLHCACMQIPKVNEQKSANARK